MSETRERRNLANCGSIERAAKISTPQNNDRFQYLARQRNVSQHPLETQAVRALID